jgi:energy-coupling factor transport system permease protein
MENFEVLRYVVIGQYLPTDSPVHRMDPALKLLALAVIVLAVAFASTYLTSALFLVLALVIVRLARVPVGYAVSGLRLALWLLVAYVLLELLFYQPATAAHAPVLLSLGPARVTTVSVRVTLVGLVRVVTFLLLISAYTLTTRTADMARAVERLLRPLRPLGVPGREIGLVFTIALRFVPTFALELEKLMKAQASRGSGLRRVSRLNVVAQARARLPLVLPLFAIAFARAEDLVQAMESRAYVPSRARSVYRSHVPTKLDWLALIAVVAVSTAVLGLQAGL